MEPWRWTALLLCGFGFLKEFRPSEPYLTLYLVGQDKNFTETEVNQQVYPVITYSYLALLVVVFLVTDLLRYKPVILLSGVTGSLSNVCLIVATELPSMQVMAFFSGCFLATDIAYFTYIYAKVDKVQFQRVTSWTQSAYLIGRFLSYSVGQLCVYIDLLNFRQLNYVTTGALLAATVWSVFLPRVKGSVYFHDRGDLPTSPHTQGDPPGDEQAKGDLVIGPLAEGLPTSPHHTVADEPSTPDAKGELAPGPLAVGALPLPAGPSTCRRGCSLLAAHLYAAYTNSYVFKWSLWWALASCGFFQAFFYIQLLWEEVASATEPDHENLHTIYNGGVEAVYTLLAAAGAFGSSWLRVNWVIVGEVALGVCALLQGGALMLAAYTTSIWVCYFCFVAFGVLYHTMFTLINAEVAKHINQDSYSLIFGVNTFFALVFQTVLTVIVTGEGGLTLDIRSQFIVYAGCFLSLGWLFCVLGCVSWCRAGSSPRGPLWLAELPATQPSPPLNDPTT